MNRVTNDRRPFQVTKVRSATSKAATAYKQKSLTRETSASCTLPFLQFRHRRRCCQCRLFSTLFFYFFPLHWLLGYLTSRRRRRLFTANAENGVDASCWFYTVPALRTVPGACPSSKAGRHGPYQQTKNLPNQLLHSNRTTAAAYPQIALVFLLLLLLLLSQLVTISGLNNRNRNCPTHLHLVFVLHPLMTSG